MVSLGAPGREGVVVLIVRLVGDPFLESCFGIPFWSSFMESLSGISCTACVKLRLETFSEHGLKRDLKHIS